MFYIGTYGDENKSNPIITTSYYITNVNAWINEDNGIYKLDLSNKDNLYGYFTNSNWSYDIAFFRDENNNIYANKKQKKKT